ncbi:MAG: deoxyhypusine synthase [Planctomycetota bacterium]
MPPRSEILQSPIKHFDMTAVDVRPVVEQMASTAFSGRDLARAARILDAMTGDHECAAILTLAGSLISAGMKHVIVDLLEANMIDAVVSTGANIVDQDFFEALGFKHYIADDRYKSGVWDDQLRELMIDRIYDTFIDEEELRVCDDLCGEICDRLEPRPHSSREYMGVLGKHLDEVGVKGDGKSILHTAYKKGVPIFLPAAADCSAGFGMIQHQMRRMKAGESTMFSIDAVRDFYELCLVKDKNPSTGLFMIGGGVPKNYAQDIAVAADIFGKEPTMHKYAVQITVADVRDGALSSSTLKEACSWGKVDVAEEQMVFSEATVAMPLIAGYAWHNRKWEGRPEKRLVDVIESETPTEQAVA